MRFFSKSLFILILLITCSAIMYLFLASGDLLIDYLANSLGLDISYTNRCGFISAFIIKNAHLKSPFITVLEKPFGVKCDDMDIWFDYSKLLSKKAIILHCRINNPIIKNQKNREDKIDEISMDIFQGMLFQALGKAVGFKYDVIFCDILMYENIAEIQSFIASSENLIVKASGVASSDKKIDVDINALFSPRFMSSFPEEMKNILDIKQNGWASFRLKILSDKKNNILKFESDRIKFSIG